MIFKEKPKKIPSQELLRIKFETENLIELNLDLEEPEDKPIELVDFIPDDEPAIELSMEDVELIEDDGLEIEFVEEKPVEMPERLEYYIEFHPKDNKKDLRRERFHTADVRRFLLMLMGMNKYEVVYLRRECDNEVIVVDGRVMLNRNRAAGQPT